MCLVEAVRLRILLAVVLILAIVGSTLADEGELCTVESNDTQPLDSKIFNMAFRCLAPDKTEIDRLQDSTLPELVHAFFKNYCNNKTIHQNCLEEVKVKSHACLNESRHQAFETIKEVLESIQNTGCQNEGELMATVFNGYQKLMDHGDYSWQRCFGDAQERIRLISRGKDFDVPAKLFLVYNEMMVIRDCVKDQTPEPEDAFRGAVERFINEIQNTMKCVHPQDNSRVLCKTVDVDTTDGLGYCPITRKEDETQTMHEIILHRMKACLKDVLPFNDTLYEAKDLDSYRHYFKDHCSKIWDIEKCIHKATMLSNMCSNKSEHESFKTVGDFMIKGIEHVCLADGEPISLVMYSLEERHENTEDSEKPLMGCLLAAKSSLDEIQAEDIHGKKRALYRVLGSFKGCVVEQLRGHNKAVFYAELLFNLFLRNLKCVDPENGHHVKCEALSQPPPTETRVCPFVSGREADPTQYAMFVDMGFTCLTALGPDFQLLDDESKDLKAFRRFFRSYCDMATHIENCVKDMDAFGKVCFTADEHQMYHIFIDMVDTSIKSGCVGNGGNLASMVYGMKKYKDALEPCRAAMTKGIREIEKHHGNTTTVSMEQFRLVNTFTECYSSNAPDEGEFKTDSLAFLRAVLKHVQCVHPDGSTVTCETIVNDFHAD